LQWTTSNETNNDHFNVLRSTNDSIFNPIGTVQGKGNSNAAQDYSFDDPSPVNGINYYQLEEVGLNGNSTYSAIDSIDIDLVGNLFIQVYPNPAHDQVTIACNGLGPGDKVGLAIYNSGGSLVYRQDVILDSDRKISIRRTPAMFTGVYFIRITLPSGKQREERLIWGS